MTEREELAELIWQHTDGTDEDAPDVAADKIIAAGYRKISVREVSEWVGGRYATLHRMRQDEMQAQAWDACAAEAVRAGLLSAEEGRILTNRKSEMGNAESFAQSLSRKSVESMEKQWHYERSQFDPRLVVKSGVDYSVPIELPEVGSRIEFEGMVGTVVMVDTQLPDGQTGQPVVLVDWDNQ